MVVAHVGARGSHEAPQAIRAGSLIDGKAGLVVAHVVPVHGRAQSGTLARASADRHSVRLATGALTSRARLVTCVAHGKGHAVLSAACTRGYLWRHESSLVLAGSRSTSMLARRSCAFNQGGYA